MKDKITIKNKIDEVMNTALQNLKSLVDVDVVVGKSIISNEMTISPLTKVTIGFVAGGGEYNSGLREFRKD